MAPDQRKARVRRLPGELLTQGDLAVADELLAPHCASHAPTTPRAIVMVEMTAQALAHWEAEHVA